MRKIITFISTIYLLVLAPFGQSQEFPNRPVTIVVPYAAGGAGGTIGAARVANARPNTERPYALKRTFLEAARNDPLVNPTHSTVGLGAKLHALSAPTTVQVYDRVDHFTLIGALARPLRWMAPVLKDVSRFVRTQS